MLWLDDIKQLLGTMTCEQKQTFAGRALAAGVQDVCLETLQSARSRLGALVSKELEAALQRPTSRTVWSRRLRESNLGLLADDLACPSGLSTKATLLR